MSDNAPQTDTASISLPREKKVDIAGRTITVRKLRVREYADAFGKLDSVLAFILSLDTVNEETVMDGLGKLLSGALPEIVGVLVVASDADEDFLNGLYPEEAMPLVEAFIEVNDFFGLWSKGKESVTRIKQNLAARNTGSKKQ